MIDFERIYESLLEPSGELVADMKELEGDLLILGAGGKMGPDLCRLAKRAVELARSDSKVIAVARFSEPGLQEQLEQQGITTITADLLEEEQLSALPQARNVLYLAGLKFGTSGNAPLTWAMNSYLPGRVAEKFRDSRIVVFSTGNVYPLVPVVSGGATESLAPEPLGEYAQSCLGRERNFEYFSKKNKTPVLIYRLNYANDVRYGVLVEIAKSVLAGKAVDLSMGAATLIWQGSANEIALRSLHHCSTPAKILNVTGPEIVSVRWLATEFGKFYGMEPLFKNEEQPTALLSNAAECFRLFGYPKVTLAQMVELVAAWVKEGGALLNKPTHFSERTGKY